MEKILISGCLYGELVRYDAGHCLISAELFDRWKDEGRFVPLCPEMAGGLPAPRPPCERDQKTGEILDREGNKYTTAFEKGAEIALALVKKENIRFALLKEQSPTCGVNIIYDGTFTSRKIAGSGLTAILLRNNGVQVFSEYELEALNQKISA